MAQADLEARDRAPFAQRHRHRALETRSQPRHAGLRRREPSYRLRARAHGEAVGRDRERRPTAFRCCQDRPPQPRTGHREVHVRLDRRPLVRRRRKPALAVARHAPQGETLAHLAAPVEILLAGMRRLRSMSARPRIDLPAAGIKQRVGAHLGWRNLSTNGARPGVPRPRSRSAFRLPVQCALIHPCRPYRGPYLGMRWGGRLPLPLVQSSSRAGRNHD